MHPSMKRRLVLGASLVLLGCGGEDKGAADLAAKEVEEIAQIKLPASARNVRSHTLRGLDSVVYLRFEFDLSDTDTFLSAAQFRNPLVPGRVPEDMRDPPSYLRWWDLGAAKRLSGTADAIPGKGHRTLFRRLVVSEIDSKKAVAYLYAFSA